MITHGLSNEPLYKVYMGMKTRCYNIRQSNYKYYGGKNVKICNKWLKDFREFYGWAILNGYRKGLVIDRIDNDGDYEPLNCRFTTRSINLLNRGLMKNNTSGHKGICYEKQTQRWKVYFRRKTLCRVNTIEEAILKRKKAENKCLF